DRGQFRAGTYLLRAFEHLARAQVSPQHPAFSHELVAAAQQIIDVLGDSTASAAGNSFGSIKGLTRDINGNALMRFSVVPGKDYVIEASTNLLDWEVIGILESSGKSALDFEDVEATRFPARFYRVVAP